MFFNQILTFAENHGCNLTNCLTLLIPYSVTHVKNVNNSLNQTAALPSLVVLEAFKESATLCVKITQPFKRILFHLAVKNVSIAYLKPHFL